MMRWFALCSVLVGSFSQVQADIPVGYQSVAAEASIPPAILYSVALTESGRSVSLGGNQVFRPWPWTLNLGGKGRFFDNRAQMREALHRYLQAGNSSVDIGIMQVNWRYQKARLKDPYKAIDPYYSLRIGAEILSDCRNITSNWLEAVGCYHSPGKSAAARQRAQQYTKRVNHHLRSLDG